MQLKALQNESCDKFKLLGNKLEEQRNLLCKLRNRLKLLDNKTESWGKALTKHYNELLAAFEMQNENKVSNTINELCVDDYE